MIVDEADNGMRVQDELDRSTGPCASLRMCLEVRSTAECLVGNDKCFLAVETAHSGDDAENFLDGDSTHLLIPSLTLIST